MNYQSENDIPGNIERISTIGHNYKVKDLMVQRTVALRKWEKEVREGKREEWQLIGERECWTKTNYEKSKQ